jgi:hypothetical protein
MLFGDWPEPLVLLGAGIVTISGIAVIWRERVLNINRSKAASAGPSRPL